MHRSNRLKHALIAPTQYLHTIPNDYSYFHLVLAHLLQNKEYAAYYRERSNEGAYIIVDNGAFEFKRPLDSSELIHLVKQAGFTPNIVVAPDYPYEDWRKTYSAAQRFSREYVQHFDPRKTGLMVVPQSKEGDYKGWLQCYRDLAHIPYVKFIGMSIIGIPHAWKSVTLTDDISFNRTYCTEYLLKENLVHKDKKHHYLGCSDPRELLMMQMQGVAYSNDSSTAYWHGINDIEFDKTASGLIKGKINKEVDFDIEFDSNKMQTIENNVVWIEKLLNRD